MKKTTNKIKIQRNNIEIDATGQAVGRVAARVAMILRGKNKASFVPRIDSGDFVVITNAKKFKFTGRKLVQKDYYHHSMHPGGLKIVSMKKVFDKDPAEVIRHAVWGMLPKNSLRIAMIKRLTVKN